MTLPFPLRSWVGSQNTDQCWVQTPVCSWCITNQLIITSFYVLGLTKRLLSCQASDRWKRVETLGHYKKAHRHPHLPAPPAFPGPWTYRFGSIFYVRDNIPTDRGTASSRDQPLLPAALGGQSYLRKASSQNYAAFNNDDSRKYWAQKWVFGLAPIPRPWARR